MCTVPTPPSPIPAEETRAVEPRGPASSRGRPRQIPALDGVRCLAIAAVLGVHIGAPFAELGGLGVDVFFVLSGFLITTLLLEERARNGRIDLPRFWGRRFLRLMPAYVIYAGALTLAMVVFGVGELREHYGWTPADYIRSIWLYYINYVPQGGIWTHQSLTLHLWSLAVEEQFYLFWPALLALLLRFRVAEPVAWVMAATIFIHNLYTPAVLHRLEYRGFSIVLGCAAAIRIFASASIPEMLRRRFVVEGWAAATLAVYASATLALRAGMLEDAQVTRLVAPALSVAAAVVIGGLWHGGGGRLADLLGARPMAYVGRISYGIYLYHMLARTLTLDVLLKGADAWQRHLKFGVRFAVYMVLSLAIASASYYLIERRFLRLKSRFEVRTPVDEPGVAAEPSPASPPPRVAPASA